MRYYCSNCDEDITEKEYDYSLNNFNKVLCRRCQKNSKKQKKFIGKYKKPTPEAKELYKLLKTMGIPVELEKYDGYKTIDIAIPKLKVNLEIDGGYHSNPKQALTDLKRTFYSFKKGFVTLRIPNSLIKEHLHETANYIVGFLNSSQEQIDRDFDNWEDEDGDWF